MNEVLNTKFGTAKKYEDGYYQINTSKEGNHGKKLHRLIFEDFYGFKIPENYVVHHKDGNKENNCILNLQLLSKTQHVSLHHKNKKLSEDHKTKISKAHKGKKMSKEARRKMSESKKGHEVSQETRKKLSNAFKGRGFSEEHKHNLSEAKKNKHATISKYGVKNEKQIYGIRMNGKTIKRSNNIDKLVEWFKENYPDEKLINKFDIDESR